MTIVPVLMAGGSGTRLWPLSREQYPKQFLKLLNERSLLQNTALRVARLE
ncbi:sugar phosphate nucleotidyltransferase, partial [Hydrocarboniphaga sp.]